MLLYIRVEKRILDIGKEVIINHRFHNEAKRHSRALQTQGLGRGQVVLADKFPPGDYEQKLYVK